MREMRKGSGSRCVDVCNGDADGLCSVLQWRLHDTRESTILTLLNNETSLAGRVHTRPGDEFLICDVPLEPNRSTLKKLLDGGARVQYVNHQFTDDVPWHPQFQATVDSSENACSSLIVDRLLHGKYREWALVGTYGKRLTLVADQLATDMGLLGNDKIRLRELGELISYNACVANVKDACIEPAALYDRLSRYPQPMDFLKSESLICEIDAVRREDIYRASELTPYWQDVDASVYVLPDTPWAHRIASGLDQRIAADDPTRAHAFLRPVENGHFDVKVRAARSAAAAIRGERPCAWVVEHLPQGEIDHFIRAFSACRWGRLRSPVYHSIS